MQYYACIIHYLLFTFYLLLILSTILINIYSLIIFITLEKFKSIMLTSSLFLKNISIIDIHHDLQLQIYIIA